MPRPQFTFTAEQRILVKSMAAVGIRHEEIARKVGIRSPKTLRKHFRRELDEGVTDANYSVAQSLYANAKKGNVAAQIFWLKTRAGWREKPTFEPAAIPPPPFIVAQKATVSL